MATPPPLPNRPMISSPQTNINRELLKLMRPGRIGGNRRCADCDAELTDYSNIWASVGQGCFVCVHCLAVHRSLGFRTKSVNMDLWAVDEVAQMTSMGNVKVNEIYERYVPSSWTKPTPDADQHQREQWILAKYKHRYFMLPHYGEEGVDATGYQNPAAVSQTLPIRLVDYFVVVGPGGLMFDDRVSPASVPEDINFREEVLDCFPEADSHHGYPLPEHLPQFVFPDGMNLRSHETPPTIFPFVLTNSCGLKMHGTVLHVTEEIDWHHLGDMVSQTLKTSAGVGEKDAGGQQSPRAGVKLNPTQLPAWLRDIMATPERTGGDDRASLQAGHHYRQLYAPKALVLLSHYPFYNLFTQFLQQIYRIGLSEAPLPIERYISNFVCEVPLPPQGQVEVSYALPDRTLTISRPPRNRLPLVDFSYRPLFASLSVENILCAFGLLLTEAKVAICSSHYALLAPAAEGFCSLLFPFVWQGAYIPVMPFNMKDVLEAPVPFLVGIHSRYLKETPTERRPQGVVFVDLDNDKIYLGLDEDIGAPRRRPHLPEREASKLRQKLNEFSPAARRARTSHTPSVATTYAPSSSSGVSHSQSHAHSSSPPLSHSDNAKGGVAAAVGVGSSSSGASGVSGVGGGEGGASPSGVVVVGTGGGAASMTAFSLGKVDLAFPNNEHLLPISTFSTEQGLTVPSSRNQHKSAGFMARVSNQRKPSKKKHPSRNSGVAVRFGSQDSMSLLDPGNHTNAPDGFNASEIRAAFLRFFVSIFRGYLTYVVMPTSSSPYSEKLFQKEAFLKSCGHIPESSHVFMNAFLDSQMFERFLEERTANPTQPEVRFFDESIAAKLNRSKTNPIKKDTPFLNDQSDAHNQVFTPPAPSNWGLPDDGSQYAYGLSFPKLNKDRYGTVRWAKRLFKTPDQHRNVSSVNHQRLLSGARWGGGGGSSGTRQTRGKGELSLLREESHERLEAETVMRGLVRLQALYRMHQGNTSFKAKKEAAATISRAWRNGQATAEDRSNLYLVIIMVKNIQRVFRGHLARRTAAARLDSVCKLQAWQRMLMLRRRFRRLKSAAELVQAVARGRNCRAAFLVVRELVILAQAAVRGWIERRVAAKQRKARVVELRAQVFELWARASTPLVYRSKFWVLFQGGAFLDLAVHEDEALRLWKMLGLVEDHKEHLARVHFNQTFAYVSEWLRTTHAAASAGASSAAALKELTNGGGSGKGVSSATSPTSIATGAGDQSPSDSARNGGWSGGGFGGGGASSPSSSLRSRVLRPIRNNSVTGAMRKFGNGANLGLSSGVLTTLGLSGLRRGSTATSSPIGSNRGAFAGQPGAVARQTAERVAEERDRLYSELKTETQEGTRVSLFTLFGLEKQKKRKRKLADVLWCDHKLADASAEVVLSVFRDHMETRHAWVENKRDARVRADLLCTVQACILSLQRLKHHPPRDGRQAAVRASAVASLSTSMSGGGRISESADESSSAFVRFRPNSWASEL